MPGGSGYVSPIIGTTIPDWYFEFDIAKEIGIPKTELDDCDSIIVSQARAKLNIDRSVEGGHFKAKEKGDG